MALKKRVFLIPLGSLAVVALAVFLLGRAGVIDLPFGQSAEASESGNGKDDDEEEAVPVPVELAKAEPRQIAAFYRASSFVEADRHVGLVARTAGRVRRVDVEEGEWVAKGDVLAVLENDRERIRLRQEELRLEERQRELTRRETQLERSLITQEDFDTSQSAFSLAQTDRDLAAVAVEDTHVRAPFDGQITERFVVPGQYINISEALFTLVDFAPLRIRIALPEGIARKVSAGDEVQVVAESGPDLVPAVVERVAPVVDPETSTVRVTLLVDGGRLEDLRVGGFVKVRITTDTHEEALSVPKLALVEEGGLRSVFIVDADSVRKVEVRTGLYDESHVEILDGVESGELVVSLGQGGLRTGSKIDVLNADQVGWVAPVVEDEGEGEAGEDEDGESKAEGDDDGPSLAQNDEDAGT